MIHGTTSGAARIVIVVLAVGCGGRAQSEVNAGAGGAPGIGPIDPAGLPLELQMNCAGTSSPPRLALPCKIGASLNGFEGPGSYNVLECYDLAGGTALSSPIPFGKLPSLLNQPVQLPFDSGLVTGYGGVVLNGVGFRGEIHGTAVFSQVDPAGRAFVARLKGGQVVWNGPNDTKFACTVSDVPFWAVRGDFI